MDEYNGFWVDEEGSGTEGWWNGNGRGFGDWSGSKYGGGIGGGYWNSSGYSDGHGFGDGSGSGDGFSNGNGISYSVKEYREG